LRSDENNNCLIRGVVAIGFPTRVNIEEETRKQQLETKVHNISTSSKCKQINKVITKLRKIQMFSMFTPIKISGKIVELITLSSSIL